MLARWSDRIAAETLAVCYVQVFACTVTEHTVQPHQRQLFVELQTAATTLLAAPVTVVLFHEFPRVTVSAT